MQHPTYLTPGLGGKSLTVVCAWAVVAVLVPFWFGSDELVFSLHESVIKVAWLLGVIFGFVSGLCWVASAATHAMIRISIQIVLVASFAVLLSWFVDLDWVRNTVSLSGMHFVNLAGLIVFQSLLFPLFGVPDWVKQRRKSAPRHSTFGRFQIADLLAMTTAFACLLGLVIRYAAPIEEGKLYWTVALMTWVALPLTAAGLVLASLARSSRWTLCWGGFGVLLVGASAVGMSLADDRVSGSKFLAELSRPAAYTVILAAFGATMYCFGVAGRLQAMGEPGPLAMNSTD